MKAMIQALGAVFTLIALSDPLMAQIPDRVPAEIKQRYAHLYDIEVERHADGGWSFDRGRLWQREGIRVLALEGDRFEMAYQHGRLLQDDISHGSLEQASRLSENAIRNSLGNGIIAKIYTWYVEHSVTARILDYSLRNNQRPKEEFLSEAYGLSEATGVSVATIIKAALGPETVQVLLGQTAKDPTIPRSGAQPNHCSSLVAWGSHTSTGEMVIGRNTDYPLNGYYDHFPTIVYYHPTNGDQKFMTTTTAGFHTAGVVGMNESGIYLSIHSVPSTHVSPRGFPAFQLGQEILRTISSIDQAVEWLRQFPTAAGWSYVIASARERRTVTVELSNDGTGVIVAEGDYQTTTNHWRDESMRPRYLNVNQSINYDTWARMARIDQMREEGAGGLDHRAMMSILADKVDAFSDTVKILPNTIAVHTTVSSSVWLPESGRMFLANGRAPTSTSVFVSFPTIDVFDAASFAQGSYETVDRSGYHEQYPILSTAEQLYIQAKMAYEYDSDYQRSYDHLDAAVSLVPDDPSIRFVKGIMSVKLGKVARGLADFELVAQQNVDMQRKALALYAAAKSHAHLGRRDQALLYLDLLNRHPRVGPQLVKASEALASKLARRQTVPFDPLEFGLSMQQADAYFYEKVSAL